MILWHKSQAFPLNNRLPRKGSETEVSAFQRNINVSILGDVSSDSEINVIDVVTLVNFILFIDEPSDYQFWAADVNSDLALNVIDVVMLVDWILNP